MERLRLDKLLRTLGLGTRSQLHAIIRAGRVTVDGVPVRDPGFVFAAEQAAITLDGKPLSYQAVHLIMLNKPEGVITAATDARQQTVMDLLPPLYRASGCMPVGRLDKNTDGLLLLTNDGTLAHQILHPRRQVSKVYWARVDAPLDAGAAQAFAQGLQLSDFRALPAELSIDPVDACQARVVVQEGKYHQVRRMFAACGRQVQALRRLSIGPVLLDASLAPGEWRPLTDLEENALRQACGEGVHDA